MRSETEPDGMQTLVIPGQTLRGSTPEVLLQLDLAILGLVALRQRLAVGEPPARPAARRTRGVRDLARRLVAVVA